MRPSLGWFAGGTLGLMSFTVSAQTPANVLFLVDGHKSMQDYPTFLPEAFTPGHSPSTGAQKGDLGFNDPNYGHFINTGCSDPALVAEMSWYDKTSSDPARNGSVAYDSDPALGSPFFDAGLFYHSRGRRLAWQVEELPYSLSQNFQQLSGMSDASYMCRQVWNFEGNYLNKPILNECVSCLTTKGWWRGPLVPASVNDKRGLLGPPRAKDEPPLPLEAKRKWVLSGGVLNVRPPKFVVARKALKDAIRSATNARIGVTTFGIDRGWYDPTAVLADLRPQCDVSRPIDESALNRPGLAVAVNMVKFDSPERSVGEALFSLGGYFSSQIYDGRWSSWFSQPLGTPFWGWPGLPAGGTINNPYDGRSGSLFAKSSDEWLKGPVRIEQDGQVLHSSPGQRWEVGGYNKSVCFADQVNAVIVVTGGAPVHDNAVPITKMMNLLVAAEAQHPDGSPLTFDPYDPVNNPASGGVNYCDQFELSPGVPATRADCDYTDYNWPTGLAAGNKNFMDDVAFFLSHSDLRGDLPGTQRVRTYVVGYGSSHPMLQSIALAGQGGFYRADTRTQ
ncbi:MAG: hypothetical protein ABW123_28670, partial [Cystobacter sp.]